MRKSFLPGPMPVRRTNLTQLILDQLRSYVLTNGLVEDDRLPPERDLAAQLSVSRPSLRNALDWLEDRQALRRVQGGGTFLQPNFLHVIADARDCGCEADGQLREYVEARLQLEPVLARLACERIGQAELDAMAEEVGKARLRVSEVALWHAHDLKFHSRLARNCGNSVLARTLEQLLADVSSVWTGQPARFDLARAQAEHEQILEALSWRDADLVVARLSEHLQPLAAAVVGESRVAATA